MSGSKKTQFGRYSTPKIVLTEKLLKVNLCSKSNYDMMAETGKGGKGCIALGIHYASYALYTHAHNIEAGYNYAACYFKGPRQLEIDYIFEPQDFYFIGSASPIIVHCLQVSLTNSFTYYCC